MWEAIKTASHGGKSIRRIFIFALVTIVMSFACLFTFSQPTSALVEPFTSENHATEVQEAIETSEEVQATETKCAVDGIGWIVCPVTTALADGMDFIYDMLSGFLVVQPATDGSDSALFRAWSYMRSFANIAFVIVFFVIIYSQLTSFGVSNYGIKRLLPRLIIAAILVNLSYYICAVAIDIFNILGYSLQDLFLMMRDGLIGEDVAYTDIPTWKHITAVILSGGTLAGLAIAASAYSVGGLVLLLVPALMTCLLAVLIALVVMAARQAIITILVILAPLAFVAYLLPNTEKLFEKWKSTFITLLVLFPAFSVVFGGSQLASIAIIKNANSIAVVLLGLLIQVAPLMITPLLIKFGGGLLGKIGGMVNNPSKGVFDRVSNIARDKAEINKLDRLSKNPHRANAFRRTQQKMEFNKRAREYDKKHYSDKVDSKFGDKLNKRILENTDRYNSEKERISYEVQENKSRAKLDREREEIRSGKTSYSFIDRKNKVQTLDISDTAPGIKSAMSMIAMDGIATNIAKREQTDQVAKTLFKNDVVFEGKTAREYAAGIKMGAKDGGQETALAAAVTAVRDADNKIIAERAQIIKYFNPSGSQAQDYITKGDVTVQRSDGESYTFRHDDSYMMEAMLEDKLKKSSYEEFMQIMEMSGGELKDYSATIGNSIYANGLQNKNPWLGGAMTGKITQGEIKSKADLEKGARSYFLDGRFGTDSLASAEAKSIDTIVEAAQEIISNPDKFINTEKESLATREAVRASAMQSLNQLLDDAETILDPSKPGGRGATKAVRESLTKLIDQLGPQAGKKVVTPKNSGEPDYLSNDHDGEQSFSESPEADNDQEQNQQSDKE